MQTLKLVILFSWLTVFSCAQRPKEGDAAKLNWMTLDEVTAKLQTEKRPVLIDLYTDWCGWCRVMDKRTYANQQVVDYAGTKFYPVKINAESKKSFTWKGKEYRFNESARTNDFAIWLTGGQLSYPTTVFIPVDGDPQAIPGFLAPNEIELLMKYFGEGHFGKTPFEKWQREFKSTWK